MLYRLLLTFFFLTIPLHALADFAAGGDAYKRGDFATAAKEFEPLAKRGDHRAMYALGSMYAAGQGVEKDLSKAHDLFREAAQNGRIDAMYKLGLMYEQGLGVSRDYRKALRYYQKSAKQGFPLSQYRFGMMYIDGKGLKANAVTGAAWLIIAAHYFIYESGKPEQAVDNASGFKKQILFTQQQELDRITRALADQVDALRKKLSDNEIEMVRQKVAELGKYKRQYHSKDVRNITINSDMEKFFLPDVLY